jgi:hypothetical protein
MLYRTVGAQPYIQRTPREHSQKENHGKEVPHEQQSFSDIGGPETSPWADPFRWADLSYLWQEKSQKHHNFTVKISKPCFIP